MDLNTKVKKNIVFRIRKIASKNVIFYMTKCFELNDTANFIMNSIDDEMTISEIIELVSKEFNVDASVVENDVINFIEEMLKEDVLSEIE